MTGPVGFGNPALEGETPGEGRAIYHEPPDFVKHITYGAIIFFAGTFFLKTIIPVIKKYSTLKDIPIII